MCRSSVSRLIFAGVLLAATGAGALASEPAGGAFMMTTGKTSQPIGHYEFCQSHVSECQIRSRKPARVVLTPQLWNQLVAVNAQVNLSVTPETDEQNYGRQEFWAYPNGRGDCEDLVLLKRRDLIQEGWPVSALLITVVRQKNGEGHAVLTVETDRGDLILDNLQPRVLVWGDTDYLYVKRQSEFDTGQWVGIEDARTVSVGSLTR